jgi:YrbI family 3-deoxy-D-manno-octulosonate 8-phosphate phosphatase
MKRIAFLDIMGVSIGRRAGLKFALISGEGGAVLEQIASKLGIGHVWGGCKDKPAALRAFAEQHGLELADVCFIGDDINDADALGLAGWGVAPASAHDAAKARADFVTARPGGSGAVREVVDLVLQAAVPGSSS